MRVQGDIPLRGWMIASLVMVAGLLAMVIETAESRAATGNFVPTGTMGAERFSHTATLLENGKVLIAGGRTGDGTKLASAELYDPVTGAFSPTGSMGSTRYEHTATLLGNGKVLIAGGWDHSYYDGHATAELYDPATGTFSPTGPMVQSRGDHASTLLPDGKVYLVGGGSGAELYNPATGTFTSTGGVTRYDLTATLLDNGKVLVAGGETGIEGYVDDSTFLYDPASGTVAQSGDMYTTRAGHQATLLENGHVLVSGGYDEYYESHRGYAELYDPATGEFYKKKFFYVLRGWDDLELGGGHTATRLDGGRVLLAGGGEVSGAYEPEPGSGDFSEVPPTAVQRSGHTATLLNNGKVLFTGGSSESRVAELFDPEASRFQTLTVNRTGPGRMVSKSVDLDCGSICSVQVEYGTSVGLSAIPAEGAKFDGWGGQCYMLITDMAPDPDICLVLVRAEDINFNASFTAGSLPKHALTVAKSGTGSGTVTSSPAGINCGSDCSESYDQGTQVTLTAAAASGSVFTGWSGACSGTGSCQVTMSEAKAVTAAFTPDSTPPLPGEAALAPLKVAPKSTAVKRGKSVAFKVLVKNAGNALGQSVKVCTSAPKKLVSIKKCVNLGKLAAGKARTATFKVKVPKKAKKGKKATITFTATGKGLAKRVAKAAVKVK